MCEPSDLGSVIQAKVKVLSVINKVYWPDDKWWGISNNRSDSYRSNAETADRWGVVQWESPVADNYRLGWGEVQHKYEIEQNNNVVHWYEYPGEIGNALYILRA